jgi:dienelactone hydrolase
MLSRATFNGALMIVMLAWAGNAIAGTSLVGAWKGAYETPSGFGGMALTFSKLGTTWHATFKVPGLDESEQSGLTVREITVNGKLVSLTVADDTRNLQLRFRGKLETTNIEGTFDRLQGGKLLYSGFWSVKRSVAPARAKRPSPASSLSSSGTGPEEASSTGDRPPDLPAPTGPFRVGRITFYWRDPARAETMSDDPKDHPEFMVNLWYPVDNMEGSYSAAYWPQSKSFSASGSSPLPVSGMAHAFEGASVSSARNSFPVLLFSPGLGENTFRYSALIEELASNGYVVAAVDRAYDSEGIAFPDGRVVRFSPKWEKASSGPMELQEEFFTQHLSALADDATFALNQLEKLNSNETSAFYGKLDLARSGFFGHSLGGGAAAMACQTQTRLRACLDLDGQPTARALVVNPGAGWPGKPFMVVLHYEAVSQDTLQEVTMSKLEYESRDRARVRRSYALLNQTSGTNYVVRISGSRHDSFTDNPVLAARTNLRYQVAARTLQVVKDVTLSFFDESLLHKRGTLLNRGSSSYPELEIYRFGSGKLKQMSH